jgi:hypothetical protein
VVDARIELGKLERLEVSLASVRDSYRSSAGIPKRERDLVQIYPNPWAASAFARAPATYSAELLDIPVVAIAVSQTHSVARI